MACKVSSQHYSQCILLGIVIAALASAAHATPQRSAADSAPESMRGSGEELELRLTGEVTRGDGGSVDGTDVQLSINYNDTVFEAMKAPADKGKFQVWLPVNKYHWFNIIVNATSRDGARCTRTIRRQQLRELVAGGLSLNVQLPKREVRVRVEYEGKGVANATVDAFLLNTNTVKLQTNAEGIATLKLLENEQILQLTAWSQQSLIGGNQFESTQDRDQRAKEYRIAMHPCRPYAVHLKDAQGKPIAGVKVRLRVATSTREIIDLGVPDEFKLATDQDGIATLARYPDLDDTQCFAEVLDKGWIMEDSQPAEDKMLVVAKPAVERAKVTGRIVREGSSGAGVSVTLGSFEAEQENRIDFVYAFADGDGKFSAEVLPNATYTAYIEDEKWVTNPVDLIPFDSRTGERKSLELAVEEGIPVRISLTQGSDRKPIPAAWVNLKSRHTFTWVADGESHSGSLGRDASAYADDKGIIELLAQEGKLEASVHLPDWRTTGSCNVRRGASNTIELHRKLEDSVEVTGKVVLGKNSPEKTAQATLHIKAIDGESNDEFRLETDASGNFKIKTRATKLAAIAYSPDKRMVGTLVIKDVSKPAQIDLMPTKTYSGTITDQVGNPIADHLVWATVAIEDERTFGKSFPTVFNAAEMQTRTDKAGNYRFELLPCHCSIRLMTNALDDEPNSVKSIDHVFFLPDEGERSRVTKIGKPASRATALPLAQRFASTQRDCRLGHFHAMSIVYDKSVALNKSFIDKELLDYSVRNEVASYMQLLIDVKELSAASNLDLVKKLDWPAAPNGVFACAYDVDGKELGRIQIDPAATDAIAKTDEFVKRHVPAMEDAEAKWTKAFQQAREQNKCVWVRTSQRYCGPCFELSRWIDDHREVLEKDFVLLKVDDVRDSNGQAVAERLTKGRFVGVPFHAIFDANEKVVADSYGPLGNIGFMSELEGKRHFKKMLDAACSRITPQEIQLMLDSLPD